MPLGWSQVASRPSIRVPRDSVVDDMHAVRKVGGRMIAATFLGWFAPTLFAAVVIFFPAWRKKGRR